MRSSFVVFLAVAAGAVAGPAFARPKILDRTVIGRWNFDNAGSLVDDSGYGGSVINLGSDVEHVQSGGYLRPDVMGSSGYVNIKTSQKKFTVYLGDRAPQCNGNTVPYYTFASRFRSTNPNLANSSILRSYPDFKIFNDTLNWHFFAYRYQGNSVKNTSFKEVLICDPLYNDTNVWCNADGSANANRDLEITARTATTALTIPLSISGKTVTIGGSFPNMGLIGGLDECMLINRRLTKAELTRLYQTGDTYIYQTTTAKNQPSFTLARSWSTCETGPADGPLNDVKPGDIPGAAYLIDNNKTMTQESGTFGGSLEKKISLTVGRMQDATIVYPNETVEVAAAGTLASSGALVFYDLRFCNGKLSAGGTSLETNLLDVDTPPGKPFEVNVTSAAYTLKVLGDADNDGVTGSGVLAKTGSGKLVLDGFKAAAGEHPKVRLVEGSIVTDKLDGYLGGTLLVDESTVLNGVPTVEFTGADVDADPRMRQQKIQVSYLSAESLAPNVYPVMRIPDGFTENDLNITGTLSSGQVLEQSTKVLDNIAYLVVSVKKAEIPDEDKGRSPVLIWQ